MRIAGNVPLADRRRDGTQRLFANTASHWWDGSEVYGTDAAQASALREGAKLRLTADGYLPEDTQRASRSPASTRAGGSGLSGLHTLFAREHNVLCDELRAHYRGWSDERVYQTARLIVSALIAKIHTVEWTPAILGTEAIDIGLKSQLERPAGQRLADPARHLADRHPRRGRHPEDQARPPRRAVLADRGLRHRLPAAPAAARRLPLRRPRRRASCSAAAAFLDIQGADGRRASCAALGLENALYSFGIAHPGAITLHNYPALAAATSSATASSSTSRSSTWCAPGGAACPRYNDFRDGPAQAAACGAGRSSPRTRSRCAGCARSTAASTRSTRWSACSPRRRPPASASPTPRSGSSS